MSMLHMSSAGGELRYAKLDFMLYIFNLEPVILTIPEAFLILVNMFDFYATGKNSD